MEKILLVGKDGMLGGLLYNRLVNAKYEVLGTTVNDLDICNEEAVINIANEFKPNIIINCAAYTNVDGCEANYELALNVNGNAVENLAKAANMCDAVLVQISTDYVFDGNLNVDEAYTEDMEPCPVSAYGKTKLVGEINAAKAKKYYVLRTAWLYGQGKNFVRTMLNLSKTHDTLTVVCDQYGSPTSTLTLCRIIEQVIANKVPYGIYHSTNEGYTVWSDFAKKIFEIKGLNTKVIPVTSEEYMKNNPLSAKRPFNSKLSKEKLHSVNIYPESYEDMLKEYLKEEN